MWFEDEFGWYNVCLCKYYGRFRSSLNTLKILFWYAHWNFIENWQNISSTLWIHVFTRYRFYKQYVCLNKNVHIRNVFKNERKITFENYYLICPKTSWFYCSPTISGYVFWWSMQCLVKHRESILFFFPIFDIFLKLC